MRIRAEWTLMSEEKLKELNEILIPGAEAVIENGELVFSYEKEAVQKYKTRNAGRKRADEKWVRSYDSFCELYKSHKSINEIMKKTGISRSTYYRYKKLYEATDMIDTIHDAWKAQK